MNTSNNTHSILSSISHSRNKEQALCRHALDTGAYDTMSDKEWVALCNEVAIKARVQRDKGANP